MRELCASATDRVVLHGDLHHDNILLATREAWLAIDPHGIVGDPGYEVGAPLFNPDPDNRDETLTALVPSRIEQLADELAMPVDRPPSTPRSTSNGTPSSAASTDSNATAPWPPGTTN